ncbi:MAG: CinA family nicotinamide mononucleotide deamidase-related protein [Planctomycetota bacterium]|nr:CinA family nicotinamide mononucleotide deamidase-related protein [Planctomycetota bacterium]
MQPFHTSAALISVGDELVLGQKLDTNSRWLSERLTDRGVRVLEHVTLADDLDQNVRALARLAQEHPLIISTGGLGPTADDLTRQALARAMGEELVTDDEALRRIDALMRSRGRDVSPLQRTQAQRPGSARMLANNNGTAPGIHGVITSSSHAPCDVFCLPGPPREMFPMFDEHVVPALRLAPGHRVRTAVLHCLGIGEGDLAQRLGDLMRRDRNPLVGTTASGGVVSIRIRYEGGDAGLAALDETRARCLELAGPFCFGAADDTIESAVAALLRARGQTLVVAESCTAGGLGALVTSFAGASDVFQGGWITYANDFKQRELAVDPALIERHGAVSEPVARAMALGALARTPGGPPRHALAITGIAGPAGGSDAKPVGTVFIAAASTAPADPGEVRRFRFTGDRADIRDRAAKLALAMLRWRLVAASVPAALWQVALDGGRLTAKPPAAPR